VLTETDPFSAIDLDNCRHLETHSIDAWAQLYMQFAVTSYQEVTPSGTGIRIWGLADGANLNRKFTLEIDGKDIAVELFRRTRKVLTITGYRLNTVRELTNIDKVFDWGVIWGERRKTDATNSTVTNGHIFDSNGSGYSIDQIEEIVRNGAPEGANRSNTFHTIVGHYVGCGWDVEGIFAHLQQFPRGIGKRYIDEDRLHNEIDRSARKFKKVDCLRRALCGVTVSKLRRQHHSRSLRKKMIRSLKRIQIQNLVTTFPRRRRRGKTTTIAISMKISTRMI
jgi:hypothetical protein